MRSTTAPVHSPPLHDDCNWREAGFAVYIHWPFCQAKCPYCDFNSHVAGTVDHAAWRRALVAETRRAADRLPRRQVGSIFFGGGTPSLMEPRTVAALVEEVDRCWGLAPDIEITLEANPTSVEAERFRGFRDAGVGRLSLGVQALNDADLRRLGRRHTAAEARKALDLALTSFPRVSADLIYARQNQSLDRWQRELEEVLALGAHHLSLYQLTIEDGTVFGERLRRGHLRGLPSEDLGADLFEMTQATCAAAGLPAYEISNHARIGQEARHNLVYWRAGDWVGIGPGAVGRATIDGLRQAASSATAPADWLAAAGDGGATRWEWADDHAAEYLMMGLRLSEGISRRRLTSLGRRLPEGRLGALVDEELLEVEGDRIRTTTAGRRLLNAVLRELLEDA